MNKWIEKSPVTKNLIGALGVLIAVWALLYGFKGIIMFWDWVYDEERSLLSFLSKASTLFMIGAGIITFYEWGKIKYSDKEPEWGADTDVDNDVSVYVFGNGKQAHPVPVDLVEAIKKDNIKWRCKNE